MAPVAGSAIGNSVSRTLTMPISEKFPQMLALAAEAKKAASETQCLELKHVYEDLVRAWEQLFMEMETASPLV